MNCKSVSVMTGRFFLLQPKLICLVVLSSNYLLYDFNATRFRNWKKILNILVLLVSLEILLHYPDIDVSNWFRGDVQWIMDKVFREKLIVQMASTLFSHFSTEFLVFACICVRSIIIRLIVMSYLDARQKILVLHLKHNWTYFWLSWKAIEFSGC